MITFVIPTLWKSEFLRESIEEFIKCKELGIELIIIDNLNSDYIATDSRIRVIKNIENINVNASWNLGVKLATNNYICLLNDDIVINTSLLVDTFKKLVIDSKINFGMFAINPIDFKLAENINLDTDILEIKPLLQNGYGFGQLMIFTKNTYEIIPHHIKVFYGDDIQWIVNNELTNRDNYYFSNLKIKGEISRSSCEYVEELQSENDLWGDYVPILRKKYA